MESKNFLLPSDFSEYRSYFIPIKPRPWQAPRYSGNRVWSPNQRLIQDIRTLLSLERPKKIKGAVTLEFVFHIEPPPSWSKRHKRECIGRSHCCKPDTTNLIKLFEDAIKGICFEDDALVTQINASKVYSEKAGTQFRVLPDHNGWIKV